MSDHVPLPVSRRSILLSGGTALAVWMTANWPAIAAAHSRTDHTSDADPMGRPGAAPSTGSEVELQFLSAADALDVEAMADRIVPGGATPGAREAHAVRFIDRALASFFSDWAAEFQLGLSEFQARFLATGTGAACFAVAPAQEQLAFLQVHEQGDFFLTVRLLTVLGMFSAPRYGGNLSAVGWKLLGFQDRHAFAPPFGHYDRGYAGFAVAGSAAQKADGT